MSRRPDPATLMLARAFPEQPDWSAAERLTHFLDHYWQQQSLLLPGAITDMAALQSLLDGDELAGLACEPGIDARIVRHSGDHFSSESGPFDGERFATIGEADWTLLVNGVDLELPGFEPLFALLRFVPDWRLDDAMVSFAAPGGSVGPHFDHYDVFLVQMAGRRRWELGGACDGADRQRRSDTDLDLVADFVPDTTVTCEPGDVLYVPPGLVHHGVAETPCLTLSLGLRAPSADDLLSAWAAAGRNRLPLALDPPLPADPGRLTAETIAAARSQLRQQFLQSLDATSPEAFARWLGTALTRPGRLTPLAPPASISAAELAAELAAGAVLERSPGTRLLVHEDALGRTLFAGGQAFRADDLSETALAAFIDSTVLDASDLTEAAALKLGSELYNAGWMLLSEDPA
ncbi:MAG: cupin domain-containing protein [Gammaproteobacteria bacterium]|nr:cupin domain-containing protein [Gammaproteobacteria bacterium]